MSHFHPDFRMGETVWIDESVIPRGILKTLACGVIVGVASDYLFRTYIVELDGPIIQDGETHKAVAVPGQLLKRT